VFCLDHGIRARVDDQGRPSLTGGCEACRDELTSGASVGCPDHGIQPTDEQGGCPVCRVLKGAITGRTKPPPGPDDEDDDDEDFDDQPLSRNGAPGEDAMGPSTSDPPSPAADPQIDPLMRAAAIRAAASLRDPQG